MSFVITGGKIASLATAPTFNTWSGTPTYLELSPTHFASYADLWRTQPALRTVVGFLARNIAQLGLDVYRKVTQEDRQKAPDHPLNRLLQRPFPGTKWTQYRLINWTVHELCIYDTAYWVKGRVGSDVALIPMPRRYMEIIGHNPLMPDGYRVLGNTGTAVLDPDQVVHFHGYNPLDSRMGVSPIETLRQILAEEYEAGQYRAQMWRNGARTGGVIERPRDAPRWSDGARERFAADWQAKWDGTGAQAGGTPVLEDGMSWKPSGMTPRDAQYVESRKLTREEVAVAYYLNPTSVGIMDGAKSGSSVESIHQQLYQDSLPPWLELLSQDIECQLLPDVDPEAVDGSVYVEFNIGEKLRGSFDQQAASLQAAVGGPWMTRTEARAMFNLAHLDEGDDLIVPLNVTKGGLAGPTDTAPDNPSNAESNGQLPGPKPPDLAQSTTAGSTP